MIPIHPPSPYIGLALVPGVLLLLMLSVRALQKRGLLHAEVARKMVHTGMGLVALLFPFLFTDVWPVLTLASLSIAMLLAVKLAAPLRRHLGGVLGSVERQSYGEIYFPLAVAILFAATHQHPILYIVPVLILAFGDAAAALIGVRYGRKKYASTDGVKSAEGSLTLFTITFLVVHVPLLLFTTIGRAECVLIGLIMALLVMELEALAWNGLDNLFIPLGAYALLHAFVQLPTSALLLRLGVAIFWIIAAMAIRRWTTLNTGALIGVSVLGYICWAVGGLPWLVAPLTVLLFYVLLSPRNADSRHRTHTVHSVLSVGAVGFIWLFITTTAHVQGLFYPYTISYAVQLALILVARWRHWSGRPVDFARIAACVVTSWLLLGLPYALLDGHANSPWPKVMLMLVIVAAGTAIFTRVETGRASEPTDSRRLWRQAMLAAAGSCLGALIYMKV